MGILVSTHHGGEGHQTSNINGRNTEAPPLKSNLKKASLEEGDLLNMRTARRKVNWPDAHGKDIAHVQEFESSALEDEELGGVRNSCVCAIQ